MYLDKDFVDKEVGVIVYDGHGRFLVRGKAVPTDDGDVLMLADAEIMTPLTMDAAPYMLVATALEKNKLPKMMIDAGDIVAIAIIGDEKKDDSQPA